MMIKSFRCGWAAALLVLVVNAADPGQSMPGGAVTTELSNIAHLRGSDYLIEVSVRNSSSAPVDPAKGNFVFSAQGDVLGQWIELAARREKVRPGSSAVLLPGEERTTRVIVTLPASLSRLYRNYEGDVNVRFRYRFACPGGPGPAQPACAGESAYWLTPGTSRWVLREGM